MIKSYTHQVTKTVEKGWPDPDFNNNQRTAKCMEYFVRGLTPPALKQKAHQFLIEDPTTTWQQLKDHVATKDLSFSVSSEFTGTTSRSNNKKIEIEGLRNQLTEIANLMKDQINATYNNNNPRFKQNQTRFCKFCKRSGHTIAYCFKYKDFKNENWNPPQHFRYQLVISQFQNLKFIWTEGKNLAFPDILSRNVKIKDLDKYQLKHKKIAKEISFYDDHGYEEKYFILRDNEKGPADDFFPILKQSVTGIDKYIFKNDKMVKQRYDNHQEYWSIGSH